MSKSSELLMLAEMTKLLGFAAEAHRTLSEIDGARRVCKTTDHAIKSMVESSNEWMQHTPEFGMVGSLMADCLMRLSAEVSELERHANR